MILVYGNDSKIYLHGAKVLFSTTNFLKMLNFMRLNRVKITKVIYRMPIVK